MQSILVSSEAPFKSNLQNTTGPMFFFFKLLLNGALHDIKIGCISLVWTEAKKYKFSVLLRAGPKFNHPLIPQKAPNHFDKDEDLEKWLRSNSMLLWLWLQLLLLV